MISSETKEKLSDALRIATNAFVALLNGGLLVLTLRVELPSGQFPNPIVAGLVGAILCPIFLVGVARWSYLAARAARWPFRRADERRRRAALAIPQNVRRPEEYAGVDVIDEAEKQFLPQVPDAQGKFRARALTTYMVAPISILLATVQVAAWPSGSFAAGLVFGQVVLVLWVFLRIVADRNPTADWVERRTRVELLRREQYLCLAQVGPYYPLTATDLAVRISEISIASFQRMSELMVMSHAANGDSWLDQVSHHAPPEPIMADLPARLKSYQYYRTGKQIIWMQASAAQAEKDARLLSWLVGVVAMLVVAAAALNGIRLLAPHSLIVDGAAKGLIGLTGLLPAISGTLLALQSVFNLRSLRDNYRLTERILERQRGQIVTLEDEVELAWASANPVERRRFEVRFQRAVLHTEATLTEEYMRWRLVTERDAYEMI